MQIDIPEKILEPFREAFKDNALIQELEGWRHNSIESRILSAEEFEKLYSLAEENKGSDRDTKKFFSRLKHIKQAVKAKTKRIKRLEALTEALIEEVSGYPNHVVYRDDTNNLLLPYYVGKIKFEPYDSRSESPAHIDISLHCFVRGSKASRHLEVDSADLPPVGVTVGELIIDVLGIIPESDELNNAHAETVTTYKKYRDDTGKQYFGQGRFERFERSWSTNDYLESKNGCKLVIEDDVDYGEKGGPVAVCKFWVGEHAEEEHVILPIHPFIRAFDLSTHEFVTAHVSQIEPYKYDESLCEKLVLDDSKKNMIDLLVTAEDEEGGDIIKGKSGGIIILSSGEPGTGKTLTAEVYAETTKKALYIVQCSQLGTDPEKLEEKLKVVLDRATRWGVVLLIDEADVYIHERGSNLEQNAIVGVFLRLLEYYSGILFLTTNRETIVDDAIISRITAHVRYKIPESDQQRDIWKIMASQYKLELLPDDIEVLLKTFPSVSGRTIKQLVRLVKVMSIRAKGKDPILSMFNEAAIYQPLTTSNEKDK